MFHITLARRRAGGVAAAGAGCAQEKLLDHTDSLGFDLKKGD